MLLQQLYNSHFYNVPNLIMNRHKQSYPHYANNIIEYSFRINNNSTLSYKCPLPKGNNKWKLRYYKIIIS
jgi:hypothetical protein